MGTLWIFFMMPQWGSICICFFRGVILYEKCAERGGLPWYGLPPQNNSEWACVNSAHGFISFRDPKEYPENHRNNQLFSNSWLGIHS